MQDDLQKRLETSTYEDLKAIKDHLTIKENAESLSSIFKTGIYEAHVKVKQKNLTYSIAKDTAMELVEEITGVSFARTFVKAIQQISRTSESDPAVEQFIAVVNQIGIKAVLKVVIGLTKPRDTMKHLGKMELAKDIVKTGGEYEKFELLGIFTQDELEEIKNTAK
ncbi:hypothetical protein QYM23_09085 [Bacillus cereus]|uniref:Uncharacterized protein n=2 Tax=Bacillus cereus group TaxID=86661 RepID=A0AAW9J1X7_BACTU|nr:MULTISPECIES: hypothetical protein [Bacillus cereus group]MDN4873009.1 hypothetical protein [Bacillus cereus]MDZ5475614.1 hypothetical protein [Bacillus thuringiensis]MRB33271.1 hypothetical protein [Bacillus thuringiensis]WHT91521.1 hypothetical protein QM226_001767 [Bacillus cereus]